MKQLLFLSVIVTFSLAQLPPIAVVPGAPAILGTPLLPRPDLLDWVADLPSNGPLSPDLSEFTSNRVNDLHMNLHDCSAMDLVFSTEGNYHMALKQYWYNSFLPQNPNITSWFYTTSPPVFVQQFTNNLLIFGNTRLQCLPHVVAGNSQLMATMAENGWAYGSPIQLQNNYGQVILVRKGNPKNITTVWDLGQPGIRIATPSPWYEGGAFTKYASTLYDVARLDPNQPVGYNATDLFNSIYNQPPHARRRQGSNGQSDDDEGLEHDWDSASDRKEHGGLRYVTKWRAGSRIHHRELPWMVAFDRADAAIILYHLAKYAKAQFPNMFDIIPIGGTVDAPAPLPGNSPSATFAVRTQHPSFTQNQIANRELFWAGLQSQAFTDALTANGLKR